MTSIRKCLLCGWQTEDGSVCKALKCKVFAIKKEGELLSFPGFMKFVPHPASNLCAVVMEGMDFEAAVNFIYEQLRASHNV